MKTREEIAAIARTLSELDAFELGQLREELTWTRPMGGYIAITTYPPPGSPSTNWFEDEDE